MRKRTLLTIALLGSLVLATSVGALLAENVDPDNDDSQHAWAENVGWISVEPANCGGCGVQVDDFALSGWAWAENFGWISLSCLNTSSCGSVGYGVTNDGAGQLGGMAWAENAGWINFAPTTSTASVSPATGEFEGYAWSENVGWISLSCTNSGSCGTADYGIKTDWCSSVAAAPSGIPEVSARPFGNDVLLSWAAVAGAAWYEIVRGELGLLGSSGGDYGTATDICAADNVTDTSTLAKGTPILPAGDGYWYLVRAVNCKGKGTYDSGGPGQLGFRGVEILSSGGDCP